jgi:hypothetical protein
VSIIKNILVEYTGNIQTLCNRGNITKVCKHNKKFIIEYTENIQSLCNRGNITKVCEHNK